MKKRIILNLLKLLLENVSPILLTEVADAVLDTVERRAGGSEELLLLCSYIRKAFDIPDNDNNNK